ncbi:hypothetical protein OCU04_011656 [Sclerotinia nivalis]|uniref:Uncharacterized protein n=1 Tax=Sclerotinia nivalis TaxID=352851 RepID=A0A9X0DE01_9HELO|nr:hypothetical protein OCU04_011656 [Sclerotinia nivalis]
MATIKRIWLWTGIFLATIYSKVRTHNKVRIHNYTSPKHSRSRLGKLFILSILFLLIFAIFIQIINVMDVINREAQNQLPAVVLYLVNHLPNLTPDNITHILRVLEIVFPFIPKIIFIIAAAMCIRYYFKHPVAVDRTSEVIMAIINYFNTNTMTINTIINYFNTNTMTIINHFNTNTMTIIDRLGPVLVSRPARGTAIMLILVFPMMIVTLLYFTFVVCFLQGPERICLMVIGIPFFTYLFWLIFGTD